MEARYLRAWHEIAVVTTADEACRLRAFGNHRMEIVLVRVNERLPVGVEVFVDEANGHLMAAISSEAAQQLGLEGRQDFESWLAAQMLAMING